MVRNGTVVVQVSHPPTQAARHKRRSPKTARGGGVARFFRLQKLKHIVVCCEVARCCAARRASAFDHRLVAMPVSMQGSPKARGITGGDVSSAFAPTDYRFHPAPPPFVAKPYNAFVDKSSSRAMALAGLATPPLTPTRAAAATSSTGGSPTGATAVSPTAGASPPPVTYFGKALKSDSTPVTASTYTKSEPGYAAIHVPVHQGRQGAPHLECSRTLVRKKNWR